MRLMLPVLFILCSLPLLAEPMTALSFRMLEPKLEEGPPTKLWRHRDDQFRLEYQEFLQINDGFDAIERGEDGRGVIVFAS